MHSFSLHTCYVGLVLSEEVGISNKSQGYNAVIAIRNNQTVVKIYTMLILKNERKSDKTTWTIDTQDKVHINNNDFL